MDHFDWGRLVTARFPRREAAETQGEWEALKNQLAIDQSVTGIVIAKAPFGAWVDIGCGFPALLELPYIAGLTPARDRANDWCPIGGQITAFVSGFNGRNHQIGLWQIKPREPQHA